MPGGFFYGVVWGGEAIVLTSIDINDYFVYTLVYQGRLMSRTIEGRFNL